jgi:hypothetical protein
LILVDKKNASGDTVLDILAEKAAYEEDNEIIKQIITAYTYCFPATESPACSATTKQLLCSHSLLHLRSETIAANSTDPSCTITPP